MGLFLSAHVNKIDKKGRVSVPASFRAALPKHKFDGIVAYASFINPCIEACGMGRIEMLSQRIETLDPFSEERDAFATAILGGSVQLPFDGEGRVMLPPAMLESSGLTDTVVFLGKGETFELWEPKAYELYAARSREIARDRRSHLRSGQNGGAG